MTNALIKAKLEEIHRNLNYAIKMHDDDLADEALDGIAELIDEISKDEGK